jgi:hypothetical protein
MAMRSGEQLFEFDIFIMNLIISVIKLINDLRDANIEQLLRIS